MTLNSFWLLLKSWWIICKILWITTCEEKNISKFQMSNERLSYKTKYIFESQKNGVDEDVLLVDGLRDGTGVRLPEPHFNRIIKYFLSRLRGIWFDLCYEFPPISLSPLYIRQRDKDCSAPLTLQLPHSSGLSTQRVHRGDYRDTSHITRNIHLTKMAELTRDTLDMIFQYLGPEDIKNVCLVNRWAETIS